MRRHAEALEYKSNFTILDTDDQKKLIRNIVKGEDLDAKKFSPQLIMYHIDQWKNKGLFPKDVKLKKQGSIIKSILKVYEIYQNKIKDLNAFDFGDLILFCVKLFEEHKDIREIYQKNFKYILVDEFQDTNFIQNKWLNLLVNESENICCVGDDDQSIYSWRGAEIKNFLTFDQLYKKCKVFKLEQNYRSTKNILETASNLIANNSNRVGKKLWSSANQGELVKLNCYRTGKEEAQGISDIIEHKIKKKYSLNNVSILVRAIYQTREFEERFLQVGIGYRVLGGIKFYERAEIKDAVSYLRIINQKFDDLAFERVIGAPKRGVGESTLNQIYAFGKNHKLCLEDSIIRIIEKGNFFEFTVFYDGIPQSADNPPWAGGFTWSKDKDGRDWIAVSCEGEGARIWWPNKDHITAEGDSVRMAYTIPSHLVAVGNGNLRSISQNEGKSTYEWFVNNPINN